MTRHPREVFVTGSARLTRKSARFIHKSFKFNVMDQQLMDRDKLLNDLKRHLQVAQQMMKSYTILVP